MLQQVVGLPKCVIVALSNLIKYLREFNLERVLALTANFKNFSSAGSYLTVNLHHDPATERHFAGHEMVLPVSTIRNLEIFRNATDGQSTGALIWVLDHTTTPFGKRLLRDWLSHPLVDISYQGCY